MVRGSSLQRRQQSRHQAAAFGEAVDFDVLVERMRVGAANAEPVERRDSHRAGEIAVGAAAGAAVRKLHAHRLREPRAFSYSAMVPASGSHTGRVTPRVTLNVTSLEVPESASMRSTPRSRSAWRLAMLSASPVQVVATQLTHWPPCTMPTREGAVLRRHAVDGDDLARHLANRRTARRQRGAGMARLARGLEVEARDRITPGDDAVIGPAGLRHQHVFVARGFRLDDVARRGRADFLVRA